jgi:hypothetical protein
VQLERRLIARLKTANIRFTDAQVERIWLRCRQATAEPWATALRNASRLAVSLISSNFCESRVTYSISRRWKALGEKNLFTALK